MSPRKPRKPKTKTERELAAIIHLGKMPSTGPYESIERGRWPETEGMLTDLIERGLALREGSTDSRGSWACLTRVGCEHFGLTWHGREA